MGEFYLEEAILDVLLKAKHKQKRLTPAEISKHAGIYRKRSIVSVIDGNTAVMMNDAVVSGILGKMYAEDKVQLFEDGWELTENEFSLRRDDVAATFDFYEPRTTKPPFQPRKTARPSSRKNPTSSPIFALYNKKRNINAEAQYIEGKFTVLKNSEFSGVFTGSGDYRDLHEETIADKQKIQFIPTGSRIGVFKINVSFESPSAAASVVQGRQSNGKKDWKIKGKKTTLGNWLRRWLRDLQESNL